MMPTAATQLPLARSAIGRQPPSRRNAMAPPVTIVITRVADRGDAREEQHVVGRDHRPAVLIAVQEAHHGGDAEQERQRKPHRGRDGEAGDRDERR